MKKFLTKCGVVLGTAATSVAAFAEGEVAAKALPDGLDATIFTAYSDSVTNVFVDVLIGFAVVVVSLFAWRIMRKALNGSK